MNGKIVAVKVLEILYFRGNPTVRMQVQLDSGVAVEATAPFHFQGF